MFDESVQRTQKTLRVCMQFQTADTSLELVDDTINGRQFDAEHNNFCFKTDHLKL